MNRRGFLSLCAVGVAGCSRSDSIRHEIAPEAALSVTDRVEQQYRQGFTVEFELEPGTFITASESPTETETMDVVVSVAGGILDLWTVRQSDFEAYEAAEAVEQIERFSGSGLIGGATFTGQIEPGDYRFVVDNTPAFGAQPDGVATGSMRLERRLLSEAYFAFKSAFESSEDDYGRLGASDDRRWWLVQYVREADQSQRAAALEVQDIMLLYSKHVPEEGERSDHNGLRILVEEPDQKTLLEVSAPLARAHARGELDDEEYFREVQRTAR